MTVRLLLRPTRSQTAVEAAEAVPSEIETVRREDRHLCTCVRFKVRGSTE